MSPGPRESAEPFVILIAPSVSEQMGGEAIKALQILRSLRDRGVRVHQITHDRVRGELTRKFPGQAVSYVADTRLDKFFCKYEFTNWLIGVSFMARAATIARRLASENPGAVVHYTSPVSPVTPQFPLRGVPVVIGPLNGNIHHPAPFRHREGRGDWVRRVLLRPSQWLHRAFFAGKRTADVLLVAGGERTRESLRLAGCRDAQFRETLDSGIPDRFRDRPPVEHHGRNLRFIHNGRLVPHKGTDLILRAMARTRNPVELHVIGRGSAKPGLVALAAELGLGDRVKFTEWFEDHDALNDELRRARGYVLPSFLDANGIVVQEAMMLGLPVVCLDWAGPSLLVTPETGFLVPVTDDETVVAGIAEAMDRLAEDGELAGRMGRAGRALAISRGFAWSDLIGHWTAIYDELAASKDLESAAR